MSTPEPRKQHIQTEYLTQIRQLVSDWIAKNAYKNSLISVTKCMLSERGGRVTVFVSIFPEHGQRGALSFLTRHGADIANSIQSQLRHRRKPFLIFEADVAYNQK